MKTKETEQGGSLLAKATFTRPLIGVARINDREPYQVIIETVRQTSIQLFFDVENGLLLRRVNVTNTMLGPLNVQWDFSDHRDVSGILIRTSDVASYDTVVRRFSEIKNRFLS